MIRHRRRTQELIMFYPLCVRLFLDRIALKIWADLQKRNFWMARQSLDYDSYPDLHFLRPSAYNVK